MAHPELSAGAEHAHSTGHQLFLEPRVTAGEQQDIQKKVTEAIAIHILGKEKTMNKDSRLDISKLWLQLAKPCTQ